jgi:hypothetical protein
VAIWRRSPTASRAATAFCRHQPETANAAGTRTHPQSPAHPPLPSRRWRPSHSGSRSNSSQNQCQPTEPASGSSLGNRRVARRNEDLVIQDCVTGVGRLTINLTRFWGSKLSSSRTSKSKRSAYFRALPRSVSMTATGWPSAVASCRRVYVLPAPDGPVMPSLSFASRLTAFWKGDAVEWALCWGLCWFPGTPAAVGLARASRNAVYLMSTRLRRSVAHALLRG